MVLLTVCGLDGLRRGNKGDLRLYHAIVQSLIILQECVGHAFMAAEQACRCCGLHSAEIILWPWLSGMSAEPWSLVSPYIYVAAVRSSYRQSWGWCLPQCCKGGSSPAQVEACGPST